MNPVVLLERKRYGGQLSHDEIAFLIDGFVRGEIPDYQMAAFAMAVCCHGMDRQETATLTERMLRSGKILEWEPGPPVVDKHSTGGVGDKSSLILAPLLACCGLRVPMLSGRGLGPTGGTLDKLESIGGYRTNLSGEEIQRQTDRIGCVITGQTGELAPADKKLYALRDATGTVASMPLITSSILSKKVAEGLDALVMDVKFGSGAFLKPLPEARKLAWTLVGVAHELGLPTAALLTDMNQPTGRAVGNAVEVIEAIDLLEDRGPADLRELVVALATELLLSVRLSPDHEAAEATLAGHLSSGRAREKFDAMVAAQGGDLSVLLEVARGEDFVADRSGYFASLDGAKVGYALIALGGGRRLITDKVDHSVGFDFLVRLGDAVKAGQPLVRVFARHRGRDEALQLLREAFVVDDGPVDRPTLIVERIAE